jgi:7-cyano-7-deazaguanine synthase
MCSYIGFTINSDRLQTVLTSPLPNKLQEILNVKGGDEYQVSIMAGGFKKNYRYTDIQKCVSVLLNELKVFRKIEIGFLFFSRLTPEMEAQTKTIQQPYTNLEIDSLIAVHGTIPQAEAFKKVEVDTEIFITGSLQENIEYVEKVGGKISMISMGTFEDKITFKTYENGLGTYIYNIYLQNINIYTNIDLKNDANLIKLDNTANMSLPNSMAKPLRIISLFSGGLDITCSTYKVIDDFLQKDENDIDLQLWYFDWGTRAAKEEIKAGKEFKDKITNFANLEKKINFTCEHKVLPIKDMFKNILSVCDTTVRLNDKNSVGAGTHEAEAAISYVPYRNQFLLTLAAAKAEQLFPNERVVFILGANLSEGMIYLDNSETFINSINNTIKVGGQKCYNFKVVAPFVNRTKTDMVKTCKKYDLTSIFSCYFPKEDGSACGTCGSCLLQQNALSRNN